MDITGDDPFYEEDEFDIDYDDDDEYTSEELADLYAQENDHPEWDDEDYDPWIDEDRPY